MSNQSQELIWHSQTIELQAQLPSGERQDAPNQTTTQSPIQLTPKGHVFVLCEEVGEPGREPT